VANASRQGLRNNKLPADLLPGGTALMMAVSFYFAIVTGVILGVDTAMVSVIIFGIGLRAVLLKQIMDKA
jgi:hypothetical protein